MTNDGSHGDFDFLSPATVTSFHSDAIERQMSYNANYFVRGGVSLEQLPSRPSAEDRKILTDLEGYYGWGGYGGSQMQWHREERISFAYIPNYLFWVDVSNEKGRRLQREVLRCARKLKVDAFLDSKLGKLEKRSEQ